jgi:hypothetical protein
MNAARNDTFSLSHILLASRPDKRYNQSRMNTETLRLLLAGCLVAMYILAMFYLRRRPLTLGQFTAWGLFALFIPALGPFLVILNGPGGPRRSRLSHPIKRR